MRTNPRPRRRPVNPDVASMADQLNEARRSALGWKAAYDQLAASLPERDRAVGQAAVNATAQQIADNTRDALRDAGYLRARPAETVTAKHVLRDSEGKITGLFERAEQIEEIPDDVA
jgi:hypothetical protein